MQTYSKVRILSFLRCRSTTGYLQEEGYRLIQTLEDNTKRGAGIFTLQYQFSDMLSSTYSTYSATRTGYSSFTCLIIPMLFPYLHKPEDKNLSIPPKAGQAVGLFFPSLYLYICLFKSWFQPVTKNGEAFVVHKFLRQNALLRALAFGKVTLYNQDQPNILA